MSCSILIDSNCFSRGRLRPEVENALVNKKLKVITSKLTKLDEELWLASKKLYIDLERVGGFLEVCADSVSRKTGQLEALHTLQSNDPHIVARSS